MSVPKSDFKTLQSEYGKYNLSNSVAKMLVMLRYAQQGLYHNGLIQMTVFAGLKLTKSMLKNLSH